MDNEEIKREFEKKWVSGEILIRERSCLEDDAHDIADWWLSKLNAYKSEFLNQKANVHDQEVIAQYKSELVERIDKNRKRTVSKEHYPQITDNKIHDRAIYNKAIDDILSLIKEGK